MLTEKDLEVVQQNMAFFDALPSRVRDAANEFHLDNVIAAAKHLGFNPEEPLGWDGELIYRFLEGQRDRIQERRMDYASREYEARMASKEKRPVRVMPPSLVARFGPLNRIQPAQ